jgi:hypothetical protein
LPFGTLPGPRTPGLSLRDHFFKRQLLPEDHPPLDFSLPFRVSPTSARRLPPSRRRNGFGPLPLLGSFSLQRLRLSGAHFRGFASPASFRPQRFHALGGFLLPTPAGLISCRLRSWDSALQSFSLNREPDRARRARRLPSCRCPTLASTSLRWNASRLRQARLQGLPPPVSPPPAGSLLHSPAGRCSPGLSTPSRAFPLPAMAPLPRHLPFRLQSDTPV